MSEPSRPHPVPGPPPGAAAPALPARPAEAPPVGEQRPEESTSAAFPDLDQRPVGEHVELFEAEHARLERELRTIDQL